MKFFQWTVVLVALLVRPPGLDVFINQHAGWWWDGVHGSGAYIQMIGMLFRPETQVMTPYHCGAYPWGSWLGAVCAPAGILGAILVPGWYVPRLPSETGSD